jgi:holo-[acyl-carrier protein] synthase
MTVLGIGIDLLHLPRFRALVSRRGAAPVAARILSQTEHSAWQKIPKEGLNGRSTQFLAVR